MNKQPRHITGVHLTSLERKMASLRPYWLSSSDCPVRKLAYSSQSHVLFVNFKTIIADLFSDDKTLKTQRNSCYQWSFNQKFLGFVYRWLLKIINVNITKYWHSENPVAMSNLGRFLMMSAMHVIYFRRTTFCSLTLTLAKFRTKVHDNITLM